MLLMLLMYRSNLPWHRKLNNPRNKKYPPSRTKYKISNPKYKTRRTNKTNSVIHNSINKIDKIYKSNKNIDLFPDAFVNDYSSNCNSEINYLNIHSFELNSSTKTSENLSCWILDSGASIHTTNDISLLHNISLFRETISLANGKTVNSTHKGDLIGTLNDNDFSLTNVYYVPDINKNLISINSLIKSNYMEIPEGHPNHGKGFWKLKKALYGLKQAESE